MYAYSGELGSCHHVVSMGVLDEKTFGFCWQGQFLTVWTVHVFRNNDGMNGMDCVREDVYFHERRETLTHASGFISSNILERFDAIFGSRFEWNFSPSAQLRNHFARGAKDISENPAGLFLAPLIPVYRVSLRSWIDEFLATWQYSTVCIKHKHSIPPWTGRNPALSSRRGEFSAPLFFPQKTLHTSAIPSYTPRGYNPGMVSDPMVLSDWFCSVNMYSSFYVAKRKTKKDWI